MSTDKWADRVTPYPADVARRYLDAGEWSEVPTAERFHEIALRFPDRQAVVAVDGDITYAELDVRSDRVAYGLAHDAGLEPGDAVLVQLSNRLGAVVAWYGMLKAGLVPVATLPPHRAHEIDTIGARVQAAAHLVDADSTGFDFVDFALSHASRSSVRTVLTVGRPAPSRQGVSALEDTGSTVTPEEARRFVDGVARAIAPTDVAVFQLSGGTTGTPKVIPRLHCEYWNNSVLVSTRFARDHTTRVALIPPFVHNAGIVYAVHGAHAVGGCVVLPPTTSLSAALSFLVDAGVTEMLMVTAFASMLTMDRGPELLAGIDTAVYTGTKIPPHIFDTFAEHDVWVGQQYGMGEGFFATSRRTSSIDARLHHVGTPLSPLDELRIVEPGTGEPVENGVVGEVAVRGPYTIRGYFDAPEHNATAFTADGFYLTGDLGTVTDIDGEPYLSIEGRLKDVVSRGGEKINAEEVELLLLRHPSIADAAIVAMPDPVLGERSCAYLVATDTPLDLTDIQQHLLDLGVAKYKWPERLEWIDRIPRTHVSKIDKKRLRVDIATKLDAELPVAL